jgi:hypothetical protein
MAERMVRCHQETEMYYKGFPNSQAKKGHGGSRSESPWDGLKHFAPSRWLR